MVHHVDRTADHVEKPSSSRGLGRSPFKAEIAGSNPAGGTQGVQAGGRLAVNRARLTPQLAQAEVIRLLQERAAESCSLIEQPPSGEIMAAAPQLWRALSIGSCVSACRSGRP
jgi:hypothetical protein